MKTRLLLTVLVFLPLHVTALEEAPRQQQETQPSPTEQEALHPHATHREVAAQLVELLQQTKKCLDSCTDEASVQRALPQLRELAAAARRFKKNQNLLPEPTTQDYLSAHELVGPFNEAWKGVRDNIARLERANLVTPELRTVLGLEPKP